MHRLHGAGMHLKHADTRWNFVGNKHGSEISFQYLRRVALALRPPFACHEHVHNYKTVQVQTWTRQGVFLVASNPQGLHLIVREIQRQSKLLLRLGWPPPKWSHYSMARISPFHPWLQCSCVNDWLQHPGVWQHQQEGRPPWNDFM